MNRVVGTSHSQHVLWTLPNALRESLLFRHKPFKKEPSVIGAPLQKPVRPGQTTDCRYFVLRQCARGRRREGLHWTRRRALSLSGVRRRSLLEQSSAPHARTRRVGRRVGLIAAEELAHGTEARRNRSKRTHDLDSVVSSIEQQDERRLAMRPSAR